MMGSLQKVDISFHRKWRLAIGLIGKDRVEPTDSMIDSIRWAAIQSFVNMGKLYRSLAQFSPESISNHGSFFTVYFH